MSGYERLVLESIVSFRARYVDRVREVADQVVDQANHGIPKTVVCYQLSALYNEVASLLADIERTGFEIAKYVGTRVVSRLEQVETSMYLSYSMYLRGIIARDAYAYLANALNAEGYAAYYRYARFETLLRESMTDLYARVKDVLSYIASYMDQLCGG